MRRTPASWPAPRLAFATPLYWPHRHIAPPATLPDSKFAVIQGTTDRDRAPSETPPCSRCRRKRAQRATAEGQQQPSPLAQSVGTGGARAPQPAYFAKDQFQPRGPWAELPPIQPSDGRCRSRRQAQLHRPAIATATILSCPNRAVARKDGDIPKNSTREKSMEVAQPKVSSIPAKTRTLPE